MPTSSENIAVAIRGLGKAYRIAHNARQHSTLAEALSDRIRHPFRREEHETFWALRNVSVEIRKGEVVGIIGQNGAGKSTLLKILSRITEPTRGEVDLYGRVGSLLEVGTGFHRELTGRENIYLNGAILGMRRREIDRHFDAIVNFAGVERFLDTPVKRYSSGMYVRLAFAVAAHLEPEILIVDEVLAVGDSEFQRKCLGKMGEVATSGRTVLFVSHNMASIQALCSRALLLKEGRVFADGPAEQIVETYTGSFSEATRADLSSRTDRGGTGLVRGTAVELRDGQGRPVPVATTGRDLQIAVKYHAAETPLRNVTFTLAFLGRQQQFLFKCKTELTGDQFDLDAPSGCCVCTIPRLPLIPGTYTVNLYCRVAGVDADRVEPAAEITVDGGDFYGTGQTVTDRRGGFCVDHSWHLVGERPVCADRPEEPAAPRRAAAPSSVAPARGD